jgi:hypothetical protein
MATLPLPLVASGRIMYVDEILTQSAQLHGTAVRVLGQCAPRESNRERRCTCACVSARAPPLR